MERARGDRIGIALSAVCVVHCLVLPAVIALLPVLVLEGLPIWVRDNEWFHAVLLVPVALVSGPILANSGRKRPLIGILGASGFLALGAALFVPGEFAEVSLTTAGATSIFFAHFLNLRAMATADHS